MPLYEYECECGRVTEEVRSYEKRKRPAVCGSCGKRARHREVSKPAQPVFGPGRSRESQMEHARKKREVLTKRAMDYDKTPAGQEQILSSLHRQGTL